MLSTQTLIHELSKYTTNENAKHTSSLSRRIKDGWITYNVRVQTLDAHQNLQKPSSMSKMRSYKMLLLNIFNGMGKKIVEAGEDHCGTVIDTDSF